MGKYHNVLYVALKVAWDWGVTDSPTICQLLSEYRPDCFSHPPTTICIPRSCSPAEIHSCEGTFERLFLGAIFGTSAPHFIAGWRADFRDQVRRRRSFSARGRQLTSLVFFSGGKLSRARLLLATRHPPPTDVPSAADSVRNSIRFAHPSLG